MTNLSRRNFLTAVACLAPTLLAGCNAGGSVTVTDDNGNSSTVATDPSASTTGKLIVGFDSAYPPYGYVGDDGEYTGFDLELAQKVAEKNDWDIQLEPINWDAKDSLLSSGAINCIWNGFTIEGRENDYTFSEPYMLNAQVVVTKADSDIKDFEGLAGKTVVTQTDSAAYTVLTDSQADLAATFEELNVSPDYNTAFMDLEAGAVDAVACDLSIAAFQLAAKPGTYVQLEEQLSSEHYAVGFKSGDTTTAETVTKTLKELDDEGFVKELCEKYADQGISYDNWCLA